MYGRKKYSKEELTEFIFAFVDKEGRVPKQVVYDKAKPFGDNVSSPFEDFKERL